MIDAQHPGLRQFCFTLRIIVVALGFGPLLFLGIVQFVVRPAQAAAPLGDPILFAVLVVFLAGASVARAVVPAVVARNARRQIMRGAVALPQLPAPFAASFAADEGPLFRLLVTYQTITIIRLALVEGVAFFLIILYMSQGAPLYAGAALLLILLVWSHFPTAGRIANWLEHQERQIEDERMLGLDR